MIKILLAEDHHIVREGLRRVLEAVEDFRVAGETGDGSAVVDLVERTKPDVLVLDLMLPGLGGLEITRRLRERCPGTAVVILSMHDNEAYVLEALEAGARAYVLKDAESKELIRGIREAVAGRHYLTPPLDEYVVEGYLKRSRERGVDPYDTLTAREREVLHLVAEGHTSSIIAERLFISPRTVEAHRANLMHKLGLRSRTDLIRYAIERGIVPMKE